MLFVEIVIQDTCINKINAVGGIGVIFIHLPLLGDVWVSLYMR